MPWLPINLMLDPDKSISAPTKSRSLGAVTSKLSESIHENVSKLELILAQNKQLYEISNLIFEDEILSQNESPPLSQRVSWFLTNIQIQHYICGFDGSLQNAIFWFLADRAEKQEWVNFISKLPSTVSNYTVLTENRSQIKELLPYLIEPYGHVTRNKLENCEHSKEKRNLKKRSGVFYTPVDVASFMIKSIYSLKKDVAGRWVDPACGTGIFLREIVRNIGSKNDYLNRLEYLTQKVFGFDVCPLTSDSCSFVLSLEVPKDCDLSPFEVWTLIRRNITTKNSLSKSNESFKDFDYVVMNPPYAKFKLSNDHIKQFKVFAENKCGQSAHTHLAFLEVMSDLLGKNGVGTAVLPLSIGSNKTKSFCSARKFLSNIGTLKFLFFDREPQSLFGEDIKTRNAIMFLEKNFAKGDIFTSGMDKWTQDKRNNVLSLNRLTPILRQNIEALIPKVSTKIEAHIYSKLRTSQIKNSLLIKRISLASLLTTINTKSIIVGSTAYNFINVFFNTNIPKNSSQLSNAPLNIIEFHTEKEALCAYSILSSKLSYWLWRVESDGFHLTSDFIRSLPLWHLLEDENAQDDLAVLGAQLWLKVKDSCLKSVNAGKTTYSYHDSYKNNHIKLIDKYLLTKLGVENTFNDVLDELIDKSVLINGKNRRILDTYKK